MSSPHTLLTGVTGLVGHSILEVLLQERRHVKVLIRFPQEAGFLSGLPVEIIQGDITDLSVVKEAVKGCDIVYHAAGLTLQWLRDPLEFSKVNLGGTQNLINATLDCGVERFIYMSTVDIFDKPSSGSFDEDQPCVLRSPSPYLQSKLEADRAVVSALAKGLPGIFIHPAAVFGPAPGRSQGVNAFLVKLLRKEVPLIPPGAIPVVYSRDLALACLLAEKKAAIGERYIVSESLQTMESIAKRVTVELGFRKVPPSMPRWFAEMVASIYELVALVTGKVPRLKLIELHAAQWTSVPLGTKAINQLGWKPSRFQDAMKQTLEFLKNEQFSKCKSHFI